VGLVAYELLNWGLAWLLNRAYKHIETVAEKIAKKFPNSKVILTEQGNIRAINLKKAELFYITKIIAHFEFFIFGVATFFLLKPDEQHLQNSILSLLTIIAGWMAIKIFGNYGQWSGPILGRATYYLFLLGSFSNIGVGILFGYILTNIFHR
jgi:hypothetical protein